MLRLVSYDHRVTLIYLSSSGIIGQDEVEPKTFTIVVIFEANELINCSRLEPLFKDHGLSWKFNQGSAVLIKETICDLLRAGAYKIESQTPSARAPICLLSNFRMKR